MNNKEELLDGLEWYWLRKEEALTSLRELTDENTSKESRRHYGEYFLYLISAIEVIQDEDSTFFSHLEKCLDGYGGLSGANNLQYLRLLRHAMIHRGTDLTTSGIDVNGTKCILAKKDISTFGKNPKTFSRPVPFLNILVNFCEALIGPATHSFMVSKKLWDRDENSIRRMILDNINDWEHASEITKDLAKAAIAGISTPGALIARDYVELRALMLKEQAAEADVVAMINAANSWWDAFLSNIDTQNREYKNKEGYSSADLLPGT